MYVCWTSDVQLMRVACVAKRKVQLHPIILFLNIWKDLVAQLVEQYTFNVRVTGSSPVGVTT